MRSQRTVRGQRLLFKEEKGLSKKLNIFQPNFGTSKNTGINYKRVIRIISFSKKMSSTQFLSLIKLLAKWMSGKQENILSLLWLLTVTNKTSP